MSDFATFVLEQLPEPPCRVLEVGCGPEGGLVPFLAGRGYDALGVDPEAPAGGGFLRARFQDAHAELSREGFDAVVAGRVLHHVRPLGEGLDAVAALAPLLLVDEFAPDRIDPAARAWYEARRAELRAAGGDPPGPPDLGEWRLRHPDLHSDAVLLAGLRARYEERILAWVPYLHRWLGDPASEAIEQELIDAGAIRAIGYRWAGARTSTTRSSAPSR